MSSFHIQILPPVQRAIWPELKSVSSDFVLYGGTALALRLGHRESVDFDFFTDQQFNPQTLLDEVPFMSGRRDVLQASPNTLTVILHREDGPVKISFFGGLTFGVVAPANAFDCIRIASIMDIFAQKLRVIHQRAEARDYIDIATILKNGYKLEQGIGAMEALFPDQANIAITLRALTYFRDGSLNVLPASDREILKNSVAKFIKPELVTKVSDSISLS